MYEHNKDNLFSNKNFILNRFMYYFATDAHHMIHVLDEYCYKA